MNDYLLLQKSANVAKFFYKVNSFKDFKILRDEGAKGEKWKFWREPVI